MPPLKGLWPQPRRQQGSVQPRSRAFPFKDPIHSVCCRLVNPDSRGRHSASHRRRSQHPALPSPLALRDPGQHHGHSPFRQRNHQSKALKSKKTEHQTDHKKDAHVRRELRRGGAWPRLSPAPVGRLGGREGATRVDLGITKTPGTTGVCVYLCALSLLARFLSRSLHLMSLYRWAWAT